MHSLGSRRALRCSNPNSQLGYPRPRPLPTRWHLRYRRDTIVVCSQTIMPLEGSASGAAAAGAEAAESEHSAEVKARKRVTVKRRKNETYEEYKARRDRRMLEVYQKLPPDEIERRMKIGQANSNRVPWNKGKKHTAETLEKIQLRTKEAMQRPEVRDKIKAAPKPLHTPENKAKISRGVKKSIAVKKEAPQQWQDELQQRGQRAKKHWEDPEYREKVLTGLKAYHERQRVAREAKAQERRRLLDAGLVEPTWAEMSKEERRLVQSDKARALWGDPEWREKTLAATRAYKQRLKEERIARGEVVPDSRPRRTSKSSSAASRRAAAEAEQAADVVSTRSSRRKQAGATAAAAAPRKAPRRQQAAQQTAQQAAQQAHPSLEQPQLTHSELSLLVSKLLKMRQLVARTQRATAIMQQQVQDLAGDPQEQAAASAALQAAAATLATAQAQLKALEATIPQGVAFDETDGTILSVAGQPGAAAGAAGAAGAGQLAAGSSSSSSNGMGRSLHPLIPAAAVQAYQNGSRNGRSSSNGFVNGSPHLHSYTATLGSPGSNGVVHAAGNGVPAASHTQGSSSSSSSSSSNAAHPPGGLQHHDAGAGTQHPANGTSSGGSGGMHAGSSSSTAGSGIASAPASSHRDSSSSEASSRTTPADAAPQQQQQEQEQQQEGTAAPKLRKAGKRKLWLNGKFQSVDDS